MFEKEKLLNNSQEEVERKYWRMLTMSFFVWYDSRSCRLLFFEGDVNWNCGLYEEKAQYGGSIDVIYTSFFFPSIL